MRLPFDSLNFNLNISFKCDTKKQHCYSIFLPLRSYITEFKCEHSRAFDSITELKCEHTNIHTHAQSSSSSSSSSSSVHLYSQVPGVPGCIHRFRGSRVPPLFTGSTAHSQVPRFRTYSQVPRFHLHSQFPRLRTCSQVPGFHLHSQVPGVPPSIQQVPEVPDIFTGSRVPPAIHRFHLHSQVPGFHPPIHRFQGFQGVFTGSGVPGFHLYSQVPPPILQAPGVPPSHSRIRLCVN